MVNRIIQSRVEMAPIMIGPRKRCSSFPRLETIVEENPKDIEIFPNKIILVLLPIFFSFVTCLLLYRHC